jgi:hypothetical protein
MLGYLLAQIGRKEEAIAALEVASQLASTDMVKTANSRLRLPDYQLIQRMKKKGEHLGVYQEYIDNPKEHDLSFFFMLQSHWGIFYDQLVCFW